MPWPDEMVIDTNVLVHACNYNSPFYESAVEFVTALTSSDCHIAFDDSGRTAPDKSTSHLYNEYEACMNSQQLPMLVIGELLLMGRARFYSRLKTTSSEWKNCRRLVPRNKHDQVVLGVAVCSPGHTLASNDFDDFDDATRDGILDALSVNVIDSDELVNEI